MASETEAYGRLLVLGAIMPLIKKASAIAIAINIIVLAAINDRNIFLVGQL